MGQACATRRSDHGHQPVAGGARRSARAAFVRVATQLDALVAAFGLGAEAPLIRAVYGASMQPRARLSTR